MSTPNKSIAVSEYLKKIEEVKTMLNSLDRNLQGEAYATATKCYDLFYKLIANPLSVHISKTDLIRYKEDIFALGIALSST